MLKHSLSRSDLDSAPVEHLRVARNRPGSSLECQTAQVAGSDRQMASMPARIDSAMQALQSRLQNPADMSREERTAIENATRH